MEQAALPAAAAVVRECMEHAYALKVPLPVELSVGPSWGRLSCYQP